MPVLYNWLLHTKWNRKYLITTVWCREIKLHIGRYFAMSLFFVNDLHIFKIQFENTKSFVIRSPWNLDNLLPLGFWVILAGESFNIFYSFSIVIVWTHLTSFWHKRSTFLFSPIYFCTCGCCIASDTHFWLFDRIRPKWISWLTTLI